MSRARRHLPHRIRRYSGQEYSLVFGRGKSAGWSYPQLQLVGRPDLVEGLMDLILRPLHSNNPPHPRRTHMLRLCGLQPQSVDPQVRLLLVRLIRPAAVTVPSTMPPLDLTWSAACWPNDMSQGSKIGCIRYGRSGSIPARLRNDGDCQFCEAKYQKPRDTGHVGDTAPQSGLKQLGVAGRIGTLPAILPGVIRKHNVRIAVNKEARADDEHTNHDGHTTRPSAVSCS